MYTPTHWTAEQLAHAHDQARRRAQVLRRAAVAEFWQGVHHHLVHALCGLQQIRRRFSNRSRQTSGV